MSAGDGTADFGPNEVVELSDVERRVLAHLPAWRDPSAVDQVRRLEIEGHSEEEIAQIKANPQNPDDPREGTDDDPRIIRGVGHSIESYTIPELTDRLLRDEHTLAAVGGPSRFNAQLVEQELVGLANRGLASGDGSGNWTMTQAGFAALTYDGDLEA